MKQRILVFPGCMPRAIAYARKAKSEGLEVVGASSLLHDPAREHYDAWATLPFVTDDLFHSALEVLVSSMGISSLFTPNPVVWNHLHKTMEIRHPGLQLINESPIDQEMAPYRAADAFAESALRSPLELPVRQDARRRLQKRRLAALFRHAESLPGMCDHEKIRALCEVFRDLPAGDVVEIGTWWGKSAFVLAQLAQWAGIGPTLCIDPWSAEGLVQKDEKGLVDGTSVSTEEAFEVFLVNLQPYAHGAVNYLRMPADDAAVYYARDLLVQTEEFGTTRYAGEIALLHVDGNHSYENAKSDVMNWSPKLVEGGWLVLDDYLWPYGNGPKRVGDEFLIEQEGRYDCAFVMGSALFVRRSLATFRM